MKFISLVILLLAISCNNPFKKDNDPKSPLSEKKERLQEKYDSLLELSKQKVSQNPYLWANMTGDGFLFNCLYQAGGGDTDMTQAINSDNRPMRNPVYQAGDSKAPWSKDMEVGFLWCIYTHPDKTEALRILKDHISYGRSNEWDMCGDEEIDYVVRLGRCKMSGSLQNTIYKLLTKLGGECDSVCQWEKANPANIQIPINGTDFNRHLAIIHRALRGLLDGGINDFQVSALKKAASDEPNNPLYSCWYHRFTDGDVSHAANLLLSDKYFQASHLPTDLNYCTEYLYQRDEKRNRDYTPNDDGCITYSDPSSTKDVKECGLTPNVSVTRYSYNNDWLPCGQSEERVPMDFLFASACVLDIVK
jgi:hypothetical protein